MCMHVFNILSKTFFNDISDKLRLSNHPIHIVSKGENYSPSAFIPFCAFGGNMSLVGTKSHMFDVPVCNRFQARIHHDQLCYEVNLNNFANQENIEKQLKSGFSFVMDYNEDRFYRRTINNSKDLIVDKDNFKIIMEDSVNNDDDAIVHLNTIGNSFCLQSSPIYPIVVSQLVC